MRSLFLFLSLLSGLYASTALSLDEILHSVKKNHPLLHAMQAQHASAQAENRSDNTHKPMVLFGDGAYVDPDADADEDGYEYSVGIVQNIRISESQKNTYDAARYQSDADHLEMQRSFILLQNQIKSLYHTSCLDHQKVKQFTTSYNAFASLYAKKEKAYNYGEISKKELLQLQIELKHFKRILQTYLSKQTISRDELQAVIALPELNEQTLSCQDLYPIVTKHVDSANISYLSEQAIDKRIQSAQSSGSLYDTNFESIDVELRYDNELDQDRYVLGFAIPLGFTSSTDEEKRAAALHQKSALEYERKNLLEQKSAQLKMLEKKLAEHVRGIESMSQIVKSYHGELMPLIETSYRLGESSAIEYLLSKREAWALQKELIETKKNYYTTLFELNSVTETKE